MNSEFYPGWLTHWEEPFQNVATLDVVKALEELLATGASVNIYMFHGGTNFGFTAGKNLYFLIMSLLQLKTMNNTTPHRGL